MPGSIAAAVVILWIWFGLTAYSALLMVLYWIFNERGTSGEYFLFSVAACMAALTCLLAVKLRSGKDWARSFGIVLASLSAAGAALILLQSPVAPARNFLGFLFALAILWLLTRPSAREWCSGPTLVKNPNA